MANKFKARVASDFEIVNNGATVGWIRVKPSGVLWGPKGKHNIWHRLDIEQFAKLAKKHGTSIKK
jgi:hypothetical protein